MEEINTRGAYGVEHTVVPSGEDLQYLLTVQKADVDLFPSLGGLSLCDQILPRTLTISLLFPVSPQNLIVMVFTSLSEESHLIYIQLTLVLEQINTCFVVNAGLSLSSPESFPQICAVLKEQAIESLAGTAPASLTMGPTWRLSSLPAIYEWGPMYSPCMLMFGASVSAGPPGPRFLWLLVTSGSFSPTHP